MRGGKRKGAGRKQDATTRGLVIGVRVNEDMRRLIAAGALARNMTLSRFVLEAVLAACKPSARSPCE